MEKKGKEMAPASPQRGSTCVLGPLSQGFYLSLGGRNLRGGLRGELRQNICFPAVLLHRVLVSVNWSMTEQEVLSHCSWYWHGPPGFTAFLGLELKYNRVLDVTSRR